MQQKRQPRWKQLAKVTVESGGQEIEYIIRKNTVLNTVHLCFSVGDKGLQTIDITRAFGDDENMATMETIAWAGSAINAQFHAMRHSSFEKAVEALSMSEQQREIQARGHAFGLSLFVDYPELSDEGLYDMAVKASAHHSVPPGYLSVFSYGVRDGYDEAKATFIKKSGTTFERKEASDTLLARLKIDWDGRTPDER